MRVFVVTALTMASIKVVFGTWLSGSSSWCITGLNFGIILAAIVAVPYFAFRAALEMARAGDEIEAGKSLPRSVLLNPFNAVFFPSLLTAKGIKARSTFFRMCAGLSALLLSLWVALEFGHVSGT